MLRKCKASQPAGHDCIKLKRLSTAHFPFWEVLLVMFYRQPMRGL
jgi:hypothetical protein